MIVLMATGNTPVMDFSIFEGMRTLSANVAVELPESEVNSTHYQGLVFGITCFVYVHVLSLTLSQKLFDNDCEKNTVLYNVNAF